MNLMIQQGWQCPMCRRVYSPTTPMCFNCPPKTIVTSNTGTTSAPSLNPHTAPEKNHD